MSPTPGRLGPLAARTIAALLVAGGVTLTAAGLLAYTGPMASVSSVESPSASASASSTPNVSASPNGTPGASPSPGGSPAPGVPTRVVIPALKIDLGVYPNDYPGGVDFPLCDAAQYFIPNASNEGAKLGLPGQVGRTTYIYAHARVGMFLPILTQSKVNNGAGMIGDVVQVYTSDGYEYLYEVFKVKRHVWDFTLAASVPADAQWLVLQTSEGINYTFPKVQLGASLLTVQPAGAAAIAPSTTPAPTCPL